MASELALICRENRYAIDAFMLGEVRQARKSYIKSLSRLKKIHMILDHGSFCKISTDNSYCSYMNVSDKSRTFDFSEDTKHNQNGMQLYEPASPTIRTSYYIRPCGCIVDEFFSGAFLLPEPIEEENLLDSAQFYIELYTSVILYNLGLTYHVLGDTLGSKRSHKKSLQFYDLSRQAMPEINVNFGYGYFTFLILRLRAALEFNSIYINSIIIFEFDEFKKHIQFLFDILSIWKSVEASDSHDYIFFTTQFFCLQITSPFSVAPAA